MSRILTILVVAGLSISSCKEDEALVNNIVGTWDWVATCGGFTGECSSPNEYTPHRVIKFSDSVFTGSILFSEEVTLTYEIKSKTVNDESTNYEIELEDGRNFSIRIRKNTELLIGPYNVSDFYKRK